MINVTLPAVLAAKATAEAEIFATILRFETFTGLHASAVDLELYSASCVGDSSVEITQAVALQVRLP